MILRKGEPLADELTRAVQGGSLEALQGLLAAHPGLAAARINDDRGSKALLHVVTDWPGFFPNGPAVVKLLLAGGAEPNVRTQDAQGHDGETPLQWAASSDDVEVAEALVVGGADLEARGACIAGGTALANAVGYGCWRVARQLLHHGATVEQLWQAAALGLPARVEEFFQNETPPSPEDVNHAFWQGCRGGYRRTVEYLFARGADPNWIPDYAKETAWQIASSAGQDTGRAALLNWLRAVGAPGEAK